MRESGRDPANQKISNQQVVAGRKPRAQTCLMFPTHIGFYVAIGQSSAFLRHQKQQTRLPKARSTFGFHLVAMPPSKETIALLAERRRNVAMLHSIGLGAAKIARHVGATPRAVRNDFKLLGLTSFTDATDATIDAHVAHHLEIGHGALGRGLLRPRLLDEGLRVPRSRITASLARLGAHRAAPRRLKRRAWYEGVGSFFAAHLDQNEHVGFGGIKYLAAIDGKSRCPLHWEIVTSLRGLEHARFFNALVRRWGCVPAHVIVDKAPAWNCVKNCMRIYWGDDNMAPTRVDMAEGPIFVRRFQPTSSVHNTPIERAHRDANDVLHKYYDLWKQLEGLGLLVAGKRADPLDLFCLGSVYLPLIRRDLDVHFRAMALRRKRTSTRNPNNQRGTFVPLDCLLSDEDHSLPVTDAEIDQVDAYIDAWHDATDEEPASPWEQDPLETAADRATRDAMVASAAAQSPAEEYVAMRAATRHILGLG